MAVAGAWLVVTAPALGAEAVDSHSAQPSADAPGSTAGAHAQESGHAEHDPHDLSHANAGPMLANPIEWRYDLTLASFVVFIMLLLLLGRFAWGTIREGLDRREKAIAARIEEAQRNAEQAAAQLRQYEAKLAAAGQEAQEILLKARRDGETLADKIREEAQADAARERDRAMAEIQAAKRAAVQEVAQRSADLAVLLAGRIMRRELSAQDHVTLIAEGLEQFPGQN
jgi:F-type H+-transporting ATPase subunit b